MGHCIRKDLQVGSDLYVTSIGNFRHSKAMCCPQNHDGLKLMR